MTESTQKYLKQAGKWVRPLLAVCIFMLVLDRLEKALHQDWWRAFVSAFTHSERAYWLFLATLLMPLNWFLESLKWRLCVSHLEKVSIISALRGVTSGLSLSLFVPNRMGEYAGRVFVLKQADRVEAALLTVIAALSQLSVTLLTGVVALSFYGNGVLGSIQFVTAGWLLAGVVMLIYASSNKWERVFVRLPLPSGWRKYSTAFSMMDSGRLRMMFMVSLLRYAVFCLQFLFLLQFFETDISVAHAVSGIAVTYLVMAVVPTIALTELGVRGAVAAMVFSPFSSLTEQVVFASSVLWLINLIVPSLVGSIFIFQWRLKATS